MNRADAALFESISEQMIRRESPSHRVRAPLKQGQDRGRQSCADRHPSLDGSAIHGDLIEAAQKGEKVTIYSKAPVGIGKDEGYLVGVADHMVTYIPKRGRRERAIMTYYSSWWMVVKGWNKPEPESPWDEKTRTSGKGVETVKGRYRGTDPRWVSDFMDGPGKSLKPMAVMNNGLKTFGSVPRIQSEDVELVEFVDPVQDAELVEKAPPGWAGTIKAMKKHMPDDKAFALAWDGYKKGKKPHYKDGGKSTTSKGEPEKKAKYKDEGIGLDEASASAIRQGYIKARLDQAEKMKARPGLGMKASELAQRLRLDYLDATKKDLDDEFMRGGKIDEKALKKALKERVELGEAREPKEIPKGKSLVFKKLDMGNNEGKSIAITREQDGSLTAMTYTKSKGGFKRLSGAHKWLEKQLGKMLPLASGIVESVDGDDEFQASPGEMYSAIVQKLGDMQGPEQVLKTISSMYSVGDVPAAVYAAAAGMARAEQEMSVPLAQAMNRLSAEDVAAAIAKGINATKSPTIKNMQQWWMSEIAKLGGDRGGQNSPPAGVLPDEVQPYIDSMATEAMDSAFEQAMGECELPIGSGALSGPEAIGGMAGYEKPVQMGGGGAAPEETQVSPAAAAALIQNGAPSSNSADRARRHDVKLPGENRISPGRYTAEEFDALPFDQRLRMAEAYDRLVGDAPDMGQEEVVDAESYKTMLQNRHSKPQGSTTPIVTPEGTNGAVVVDDVEELDDAFAAALASEDSQAA